MKKGSGPGTSTSFRRVLLFAALLAPIAALSDDTLATAELSVGGKRLEVEIADEAAGRRQGLMFRKYLPADRGMLFIWPEAAPRGMWMKNTLIALDVAFIDDQHRIVNIETMQPQTLRPHRAARPVRYALEVNAGWFAGHGVKPGDPVAGLEAVGPQADSEETPRAGETLRLR